MRVFERMYGLETVVLRYFNVFGPYQQGDSLRSGVLALFCREMLTGEQPTIYGDGTQKRCFSFVQDDLRPLVRLAYDDVVGEIINIGPDEEFTVGRADFDVA